MHDAPALSENEQQYPGENQVATSAWLLCRGIVPRVLAFHNVMKKVAVAGPGGSGCGQAWAGGTGCLAAIFTQTGNHRYL